MASAFGRLRKTCCGTMTPSLQTFRMKVRIGVPGGHTIIGSGNHRMPSSSLRTLPESGEERDGSGTRADCPRATDNPICLTTLPSGITQTYSSKPHTQNHMLARYTLPPLSPAVLASELITGQLWANAKLAFPKVPWGPAQLAQVMAWGAALAVLSVTATSHTPQLSALMASDELHSTAVRHLGLEMLCCCLAIAVLYMGLRQSKPRSHGLFEYSMDSKLALTVAALATVAYPLADPLLYGVWLHVEQVVGISLPDPGASFVSQLQGCQEAGDGVGVVMHVLASCIVGPLWEETFWRGFFLASLTRVLPMSACVALSSAAFAGLHLAPGTLLPIAVMSVLCDSLYLRSGSLAAPLLLHMGWNATQVAGILMAGKDSFV